MYRHKIVLAERKAVQACLRHASRPRSFPGAEARGIISRPSPGRQLPIGHIAGTLIGPWS